MGLNCENSSPNNAPVTGTETSTALNIFTEKQFNYLFPR
jgi:hypothetical protein